MQEKYNHKKIELYVQKHWKKNKTFHVKEITNKKKYYCLSMIPYPSGDLHMGHVRNYTIGDIIARFNRMKGKNVLHPIGWDSFGLPAEEAAIKNNINPNDWTNNNIKSMRKQLKKMGFSYDWSREIKTSNEKYYKWEQWFFNELYKKKLAYKKTSFVNWCIKDKTVLANEQVINGNCWRCQNKVTLKKIPQWFIKINKYAKELFDDLKKLKHWPKKIKLMQKNWIGKSIGFELKIKTLDNKEILIYSTRIDTIMGAEAIVLAPEHKLSTQVSLYNKKIKIFLENIDKNKQKIDFLKKKKVYGIKTQLLALHPLKNKKLPVWISNYVDIDYATGAIMLVPAHNKKDLIFANKYKINFKPVILDNNGEIPIINNKALTKKGILCNSNQFNKLNYYDACKKISIILKKSKIGKKKTVYKLKDWCVSRQRPWGTPIPMGVNIQKKIEPISFKNLPKFTYKKNKRRIIFVNKKKIKLEKDTFDTFMESSWYYARYTSYNCKNIMIEPNLAKYWLPVDQYIGGIEHATMHLIYIRFFHKLLRDAGLVEGDEPIKKLLCQGMVLSKTFYYLNNKKEKKWISYKNIIIKKNHDNKIISMVSKINNKKIYFDGIKKMSKSKNNGINPTYIINKYGSDSLRLFIIFAAPVENSLEWNEDGLKGMSRFLNKLWNLTYKYIYIKNKKINLAKNFKYNKYQRKLLSKLNKTIYKVSQDIELKQSFNTAISSIIKFFNKLNKEVPKNNEDVKLIFYSLKIIIILLYPFAPHITFFLWKEININSTIDDVKWPKYNKLYIINKINIVIQINGKKKIVTKERNNISKKELLEKILKKKIIKNYLKSKKIIKIIYITNKVLNFVIEK
ncbi:leucine--tRNA ligase [Buchnera aphidicola (Taiwanaphis decaspermi)]|uniref:leucine--tRNA ligase n=1 Tax=Buchnera aphidicola TaxID=9 RepID=UPI0031B86EB0